MHDTALCIWLLCCVGTQLLCGPRHMSDCLRAEAGTLCCMHSHCISSALSCLGTLIPAESLHAHIKLQSNVPVVREGLPALLPSDGFPALLRHWLPAAMR